MTLPSWPRRREPQFVPGPWPGPIPTGTARSTRPSSNAFFAALAAEAAATEAADSAASAPSVPKVVPARSVVLPAVDTEDPRLFLVGDSVLEASAPTIEAMLPSWDVTADTRIGRRVPEGAEVIEERRDEIGDVAVIVLGHNYSLGEGFAGQYSRIMRQLWSLDRVVWVTVAEWSPGQREVNALIRQNAQIWPNVVVADWAQLAAANPGYLARDGVHLTGAGVVALADLAARAVGSGPRPGGVVSVEVPVAPDGSPATGSGSVPTTRPSTSVPAIGASTSTTAPDQSGSTTTSTTAVTTSTVPTSTVPTTAVPTSTVPTTAVPTSTVPTSSVPTSSVPEGSESESAALELTVREAATSG